MLSLHLYQSPVTFIMFEIMDKTLNLVTIQMKATEQHFSVALFITLYKLVLTFESVDQILNCDHSIQLRMSCTFVWYCFLRFYPFCAG